MGVGHLQTAAVYFQALRMVFSTGQEAGSIPSTVDTPIKLFDPVRHIHVATVNITLQFELTSIPLPVINFLRAYKNLHSPPPLSPGGGGVDQARAELGLKQAFQLADKDNSGGVSSSEVILFFS
jgi:hypothetical protein